MSKKKILKIMGVALTLAMVFSLGAVLIATPVSADPDEWTTYDLPDAGEDGDYFWDATIDAGPGPIAMDIDGNFWAYISDATATDDNLMMSSDGGRSWDATDYVDDVDAAILDIEPSPIDEDTVYVLVAGAVWKTDDAGDTWDDLGDPDAGVNVTMTVAEADDTHYIYVATSAPDVVYYEDAFGGAWTDLDLDVFDADLAAVLAVEASPDFDNDGLVFAVFTTTVGTETYVGYNDNATIGAAGWDAWEIRDDVPAIFVATAADIAIPEDFDEDDAFEFFVGVSGPAHAATLGGVYRIYGDTLAETDLLDDIDDEVMSLSVVGEIGSTYILAGIDAATGDAGVSDVWYSDDDGDNWLQASDEGIQPAGVGLTYVIADEDIADNGMGWAATDAAINDDDGAGVHLTLTGGESWVGIGLLDTDAAALVDIGPSPDWVSDEIMFVLYTNTNADAEILRYDGSNWERVFESDDQYGQLLDMVDCSPEFGSDETVFAALAGGPNVLLSEDSGTVWEETRNAPATMASWVIVDSDTIIAGGAGDSTVYVTDRQGGRAWDDYEVETGGANDITSLAVSGDIVICGDDSNAVFISEDFAETWDVVGNDLTATAAVATYVGFDTDFGTTNTIYAASDDVVSRFLDVSDLDEDWEDFTLDGTPSDISGLAVADGVVYVSDADAADDTAGAEDGAVQRTVDPLDDVDDVDETEFDFMAEGLDADAGADEVFDMLYLSEGSTILWAVDTVNAVIYTIEDLLAVPASGGEADPDVDSATLTWDGFDNATDYDVVVYSDEDMGLAYEWFDAVTGDDDPILNVTDGNTTGVNALEPLDAGTEYWWQVRATAPVNSKWSEIWTFTTLPATMTIDADQFGPAIGATNVPIRPSFGWQDIEEADEYMFELADNPDFTTPIVSTTTTNPVFQLDTALDYLTNYFWRVKAISGTGQSRWATGTFTTMAEPVEAPAPPPPAATPTITIPAAQQIAPNYIYAIIGIGAALAVVVIVLIVRTRKV